MALDVTFLFIAAHETTAAILNNVTNHITDSIRK